MYRQPYNQQGQYGGTFQGINNNQGYNSSYDDESSRKASIDPLLSLIKWFKARSHTERMIAGIATALLVLVLMYFVIEDHDTLFIISEVVHALGIVVLGYKLLNKRNSGGLSLASQELTALFLGCRLFCSFVMEYDVHTILDLLSLGATGAVIYGLRGPLRSTYQKEFDTMAHAMVLVPCFLLALLIHPSTRHNFLLRTLWAFCVYLEAISVLPQLRMMQKSGAVEKFTAHYVFALGLSRFIACSHWILQILEGDKFIFKALGSGMWPIMVLVSEIVQTFILADFCYIYVKSFAQGTGVIQLPAGIV